MTIKEFFSLRTNKLFWLSIVAMIAISVMLFFIVFKGLDVYTRHGEAIEVPDVRGKTVKEATGIFKKNKLQCVVSDSIYISDRAAGSILDYNPPPGQKVKEGRTIYLTVNTMSVPLVVVPDVSDNSSYRQAQAMLIGAGFRMGPSENVTGELDWVYGVKYQGNILRAGDKAPMGATLTLMVGDGSTTEEEYESPYNVDSLRNDVTEESWF